MKRVAIVAHGLSDGGAERVAALLANHFAESGYSVHFIAAYSPAREYPLHSDVSYVYIPFHFQNKGLKLLERSLKIDEEIRNFRADVVVSFIINELLFTGIKKNIPIVYSLRNDPHHLVENRLNRILCNFLYGRSKRIVFQTAGARDFFGEKIRDKGVIIPNPLTRNLPQWNSGCASKTIVTACRLNKQKNIPMMIEGFSTFHKAYPDYVLKIFGKGDLLGSLQELVRQKGLEESILFPGHSEAIHEIMADASMFVLTSDFEGLSNSMLEALAIGVPSVCTDCPPGGAAEYIENGVNGLLIPVGDSEQLAASFCRMAADRELCIRMSENAGKIRDVLDVDKVLKQWEEALE